MHCNSGTTVTDMIVDLNDFDNTIWYNLGRIENIMSLNMVRKCFKVTYDSK